MRAQSEHAGASHRSSTAEVRMRCANANTWAQRLRVDWTYIAIFLGTAATTLMFWALVGHSRVDVGGDYSAFYEPVARTILATGRPLHVDGLAATRYPPGYPFILAGLFGFSRMAGIAETIVLQMFALCMSGVSGLLLYRIARDVWPAGPALAAPLLWAVCPHVLWLSSLETSELVFCAVFYAACVCLWRALIHSEPTPGRFLLPGVLIGVAMLIRPILIGGGVLLSAVMWLALSGRLPVRSRVMAIVLFLTGTLAIVAPWEAWVYRESGRLILLSDGGVPGMRDGLTFATNLKGFRGGVAVPPDVEAVMRGIQAQYQHLHTAGDVLRVVREQAREYPMGVARLFGIKAARSWYGTDSHARENLVLAIQVIFLLPVVAGAVVALRQPSPRLRLLLIVIASFTLYFWAMTILVLSIVRYMVPAMGLLFTLAPGAVVAARAAMSPTSRWAVQS